MDKIGRLNGIIAALEGGRKPAMAFGRAEREEAIQFGLSALDGVLFEMEHTPYSASELRDALQVLLNRRRMIDGGALRPQVTPFVRIPANGAEMNTWMAKQVLDQGAYGVVFPHIATAEQARNAVAACRYGRPKDAPNYEPKGLRGDAPNRALLGPDGAGILRARGCLAAGARRRDRGGADDREHRGHGEPAGDSRRAGRRRHHDRRGRSQPAARFSTPVRAPSGREAKATILAAAKRAKVRVAHPHVTSGNVAEVIAEGYDILFTNPSRSYATLEKAKSLM